MLSYEIFHHVDIMTFFQNSHVRRYKQINEKLFNILWYSYLLIESYILYKSYKYKAICGSVFCELAEV